MISRLQDLVIANLLSAIAAMDIPAAVRDQVEYEVIPFMTPGAPSAAGEVRYLIGLGLPVGQGDSVMVFRPLEDPHDAGSTVRQAESLFADLQDRVAAFGRPGHL